MIIRQVSLVITINDGLKGKPLLKSQVKIMVDGQRYNCIYKQGGMFVFVDLSDKEHIIELYGNGYQNEKIKVITAKDKCIELMQYFQPSDDYKFSNAVTKIVVDVGTMVDKDVVRKLYTIDNSDKSIIKLAQDDVNEQTQSLRVFSPKKLTALAVPSLFYIEDGLLSEMINIVEVIDEQTVKLENPVHSEHKRGTKIYSVKQYTITQEGKAFVSVANFESIKLLKICGRNYSIIEPEINKNKFNKIDWKD